MEGQDCKAMIIAVGRNSQWGKIKGNLVTDAVNTPLQVREAYVCVYMFVYMCVSVWYRQKGLLPPAGKRCRLLMDIDWHLRGGCSVYVYKCV